jgi:Uma2 family endonuclease
VISLPIIKQLQEYALVSLTEMKVEFYRLEREGNWISQIYGIGDDIYFTRVDFCTPIPAIY